MVRPSCKGGRVPSKTNTAHLPSAVLPECIEGRRQGLLCGGCGKEKRAEMLPPKTGAVLSQKKPATSSWRGGTRLQPAGGGRWEKQQAGAAAMKSRQGSAAA